MTRLHWTPLLHPIPSLVTSLVPLFTLSCQESKKEECVQLMPVRLRNAAKTFP